MVRLLLRSLLTCGYLIRATACQQQLLVVPPQQPLRVTLHCLLAAHAHSRRRCTPPTPPVVSLTTHPGGELVYFEMDALGQLLELAKKDMDGDVACLDIAPVLPGALRCRCGAGA